MQRDFVLDFLHFEHCNLFGACDFEFGAFLN